MRDANVTWDLPPANDLGEELEAVEVQISADAGANFTAAGEVLVAATQEFFFQQLDFGNWVVKLIVRDAAGRRSGGIDTPFVVPNELPPGDVVNVQVALS